MTATFRNTAITVFDEELPNSVINMKDTFFGCIGLIEFNVDLPNNVKNITNTFNNCTSLTTVPSVIPNSVINMDSTFSLANEPTTISNNVTNMRSTFYNCGVLTTLPTIIPSSVTNMFQTFYGYSKLQGEIEINANIDESIVYEWEGNQYKGYDQTFLNAATESSGIIIKNTSTCRDEVLNTWVSKNSKITLEGVTK